jgi:hypothetical protein
VTVRLTYTSPRVYPVEETTTFTLFRYPGAASGWIKHPHLPRTKPKPKRSGKRSGHTK